MPIAFIDGIVGITCIALVGFLGSLFCNKIDKMDLDQPKSGSARAKRGFRR